MASFECYFMPKPFLQKDNRGYRLRDKGFHTGSECHWVISKPDYYEVKVYHDSHYTIGFPPSFFGGVYLWGIRVLGVLENTINFFPNLSSYPHSLIWHGRLRMQNIPSESFQRGKNPQRTSGGPIIWVQRVHLCIWVRLLQRVSWV